MSKRRYGKVNCIIEDINIDGKEMVLNHIYAPLEKRFIKVPLADESDWDWVIRLKEIIKSKIVYIAIDFDGLKFEYI